MLELKAMLIDCQSSVPESCDLLPHAFAPHFSEALFSALVSGRGQLLRAIQAAGVAKMRRAGVAHVEGTRSSRRVDLGRDEGCQPPGPATSPPCMHLGFYNTLIKS